MSIFKTKLKHLNLVLLEQKHHITLTLHFGYILKRILGIKQGDLSNLYETETILPLLKLLYVFLKQTNLKQH